MDVLERTEKIIPENAFKQKKKEPRLKFNSGLALISLRTTGPRRLEAIWDSLVPKAYSGKGPGNEVEYGTRVSSLVRPAHVTFKRLLDLLHTQATLSCMRRRVLVLAKSQSKCNYEYKLLYKVIAPVNSGVSKSSSLWKPGGRGIKLGILLFAQQMTVSLD